MSTDPAPAQAAGDRPAPHRPLARGVVIALAVLCVLGVGLRVWRAADPPVASGEDSKVYALIAESLYEHGHYGVSSMEAPYDWSPGGPFFYAGIYALTGGPNPELARIVVAVLGALTIVLTFVLGRRLGGPAAGLVAAALAAVYPTFIHYDGLLVGEPLAAITVPAAVLALLWATDGGGWARWAAAGVLLGLSTLLRPEYLLIGVAAIAVAALLVAPARGRGPAAGSAAMALIAFVLCVAPWSIHVSREEGRFVPVSTGSGKALFIGTYLPGEGIHLWVKKHLLVVYKNRHVDDRETLERIPMTPLLNRVAERNPELERDASLRHEGVRNVKRYLKSDPLGYAGMLFLKAGYMWQGSTLTMQHPLGWAAQGMILLAAIGGAVAIARRRRRDLAIIGLFLVTITVVGALLLSPPRRNVPVMPLVMALAGVGAVEGRRRLVARRSAAATPGPARQPVGVT